VVDTAKLVARVETKGVKRATDELDRFSDEAKDAEKSSVNLGKAAKAAAGFIVKAGASIGAAGAALTAIAIKASDAQKERNGKTFLKLQVTLLTHLRLQHLQPIRLA